MKLIFHPFEKVQEHKLLLAGVVLTIAGSYTAYLLNARFDGVIDMHLVPAITFMQPFIDNAINIVSLFLFLYALGYYINKKTRPVDVLNAAIIARAPFYLLPLFNIRNFLYESTSRLVAGGADAIKASPAGFAFLSVFGILTIGFLVWFVLLLYNGFKIATNLKSASHKVLFGVSILLAEALSKILINSIVPY